MKPIKAWALVDGERILRIMDEPAIFSTRECALAWGEHEFQIVRVEIREVAPTPKKRKVTR